jgi:hypothetical protein
LRSGAETAGIALLQKYWAQNPPINPGSIPVENSAVTKKFHIAGTNAIAPRYAQTSGSRNRRLTQRRQNAHERLEIGQTASGAAKTGAATGAAKQAARGGSANAYRFSDAQDCRAT